ncbi:unnamed protein product [Acanthoscelides obtectus]|uniref:Uncharacterized protein n=1 Tax=Acanthoscelides obtectus TaxID=200917 RepID=A0A9P0K1N2_ACAOB|nr:unnamed protein product [Acanthoscelides obtectus]CAK1657078.1 hypothetical protein AOBTE_LOCUS20107 [Acanthoscelides obtectus]
MELTKRLMSELEYSSELQKTLLKSYENNVYVTPKIALQPNPSTFSDILKKPSTASSSVLLIKADAVENADSKNIFQEITSSVNPANLNVCINSTKRIKNESIPSTALESVPVSVRRSAPTFVAGRAQSCRLPLLRAASADQSGALIGRSPTETIRARLPVFGCRATLPRGQPQSIGIRRVFCIAFCHLTCVG